jgi:hypothetical protein
VVLPAVWQLILYILLNSSLVNLLESIRAITALPKPLQPLFSLTLCDASFNRTLSLVGLLCRGIYPCRVLL